MPSTNYSSRSQCGAPSPANTARPTEGWCSGCGWRLPSLFFVCAFSLPPTLTLPPGQGYAAAPPETSWHAWLPSLLLQGVVLLYVSQPDPLLSSCCAMAGDIEPNSGPRVPKYPCVMCSRDVRQGDPAVCCEQCNTWVHNKCSGLSDWMYSL